MTERHLERLTWKQFRNLVPSTTETVLLPIGTVEAHGPGPLGTDAIIPAYLAGRLAGPLEALVAPTVTYGITRSLIGFPGSLTVSQASFESYLLDIGLALSQAGFRRILMINGHGGNNEALKRVAEELWLRRRVRSAAVHWWLAAAELSQRHFGGSGHAGADEIGAILAIEPALVRRKEHRESDVGWKQPGIEPFPFPRAVILAAKGKGRPQFDLARSKKFLEAVVRDLTGILTETMKGWEQAADG